MIANYHTHTWRCGHAVGHERAYAAAARRAGLKTLGFSDHTPYDFFDAPDYRSPIRMGLGELPDYAGSVRALAAEYRGEMEILLGVEAEYYPKYFSRLTELLRENGVAYMLLGQHCLGNEIGGPYCGRETEDPAILAQYVSECCEALDTGLFTCFAHPDLIRFSGDRALYRREMRRLCRKAVETDTPLEINLLGLREERNYPDERFWRIAGEEGCAAVLGSDAHRPEHVLDPKSERRALALAARCGLRLLDELPLRRL